MKTIETKFHYVQDTCNGRQSGVGVVRLRQYVTDGPKSVSARMVDLEVSVKEARFMARMLLEAADKAEAFNESMARHQPQPAVTQATFREPI